MMRASGVIAAVAALALAPPAQGQFIRYTDDNGNFVYVDRLQSVPERFRSRAVSVGSRGGAPAGAAVDVAPPGPSGGTTVRYTPGQRIMVDVRINGAAPARLLLDTGADRTMVSPSVLAAAGVSLSRPIAQAHIAGVGGTDRVSFVLVDSIEIGEVRVRNLPVVVYEMPHAAGDGLLGRDFLDRFTVHIDSARGVVTLSPR